MTERIQLHSYTSTPICDEIEESPSMKLRSSAPKINDQNAAPIKKKSLVIYRGKIFYHTTFIDCAMCSDKLLMQAKSCNGSLPLGFDMEWPFSFQTGPGKTALIQLSPNLNECYLFHVGEFQKLPKALVDLLELPNVILAGVNIRNDIHKLQRDFPHINKEKIINNCVDSRTQAKDITNETCWNMEKMVDRFFGQTVIKDKKVRNSKWNVVPLDVNQKKYAATDAYISLKLYLHLNKLKGESEDI